MGIDLPAPDRAASSAAISTVGWSRGKGCSELAAALGNAVAVKGDWKQACIEHKLDLLVTRRLPSFDLVSIAVPYELETGAIRRVTAAIGEGPHSRLASQVAAALTKSLDVPGELTTVARPGATTEAAAARLARMGAAFPGLDKRVVAAPNAATLVKDLSPQTLLVLGAPGGSWLQRQLFGPGHRMRVAAPGGAVVVRHAPRRCYHAATPAAGQVAGPHLSTCEALRLFTGQVIPVAEAGRLIGIVRRAAMIDVPPDTDIGELMEPPVALVADEPATAIDELRAFLDGGPVPVVDASGRLVGSIAEPDSH